MIAIMCDINQQTYVPGAYTACTACTACTASLYLLVYKRKHPQTLGCISAYIRKIIPIIFLTTCATCFSPFFFIYCHLASLFVLLQYTTV